MSTDLQLLPGNYLRNDFGHGKAPKKALAPPDQIGKEAPAYSEFLGQRSYTINLGNILNMRALALFNAAAFGRLLVKVGTFPLGRNVADFGMNNSGPEEYLNVKSGALPQLIQREHHMCNFSAR